jgi:hypothetical protein
MEQIAAVVKKLPSCAIRLRRETGAEQPEMTNPFRRHGAASRLIHDEAWVARPAGRVEATAKTTLGPITGLGAGCSDGETEEAERPARRVPAGQDWSPRSAAAACAR